MTAPIPQFGPGETVIVSLDTTVYSDYTCIVCAGLIPYIRAASAMQFGDRMPKFCGDTCMNTSQVRTWRKTHPKGGRKAKKAAA